MYCTMKPPETIQYINLNSSLSLKYYFLRVLIFFQKVTFFFWKHFLRPRTQKRGDDRRIDFVESWKNLREIWSLGGRSRKPATRIRRTPSCAGTGSRVSVSDPTRRWSRSCRYRFPGPSCYCCKTEKMNRFVVAVVVEATIVVAVVEWKSCWPSPAHKKTEYS